MLTLRHKGLEFFDSRLLDHAHPIDILKVFLVVLVGVGDLFGDLYRSGLGGLNLLLESNALFHQWANVR